MITFEDFTHYKKITLDCLDQHLKWKANLDLPQPQRKRKDIDDRGTIQSAWYWLQSYLNGLVLMELKKQ